MPSPPVFHNTLGLSGDELASAKASNQSVNDAVLGFFSDYFYQAFTASQVYSACLKQKHFHAKVPITSLRRAISDLERKKLITKLAEQRPRPLGKKEYLHLFNQTVTTETPQL